MNTMEPAFFVSNQSDALWHFLPADAPQRNALTGLIFIQVTDGQATIEVDGRSFTLYKGALLTLLPSHLLHTVTSSEDFRCLTLAFPFDAMADFPYMLPALISEKMERSPFISLSADEQQRLAELHCAILRHYALTSHPSYKEILRSLAFIFTAEVCAIYAHRPITPTATRTEELTDGFFHLLHEHFSTHRDAAFYADRLCLTLKYLARVIRQVTGHPPTYWIADFNVREAKSLLKSTTLTITQISEQLNFPNSSFFARYFKRYAGVAPQEYRVKGGIGS